MWRTADGAPVGEPITGHHGSGVYAVAAGALPDGTPVIIGGGGVTVRVWRTADGAPVGEPITGHNGEVRAVAAGALPDGTPVIISGGYGGVTVRVWRTVDGTPLVPPLNLPGSVQAVAVDGNVIITASGTDIAVHQPTLSRHMR